MSGHEAATARTGATIRDIIAQAISRSELRRTSYEERADAVIAALMREGWRLVDPATRQAIESVLGRASRGEPMFAADYDRVRVWLAAGEMA